jgi:hypothetical protein
MRGRGSTVRGRRSRQRRPGRRRNLRSGGAEIWREEEEVGAVKARSGVAHPASTSSPELLPLPLLVVFSLL